LIPSLYTVLDRFAKRKPGEHMDDDDDGGGAQRVDPDAAPPGTHSEVPA